METTPQIEISALRKAVKKSMIDADLDRYGSTKDILPLINDKLGRQVHINSYYMALSGNREGEASREILTALYEVLQERPKAA